MSSLETFWWILSRWSINTIPHPCTFTAYQVIAHSRKLYWGLAHRPPTQILHPHSPAVKTLFPFLSDRNIYHNATQAEIRVTKFKTPTKRLTGLASNLTWRHNAWPHLALTLPPHISFPPQDKGPWSWRVLWSHKTDPTSPMELHNTHPQPAARRHVSRKSHHY